MHVGISIQSNIQTVYVYMQLHNSFSHIYTVYLCSEIHICRPGQMLWQTMGHE